MQRKEELSFTNDEMYNTFKYDPSKRQEALSLLSIYYEKAIQKPQTREDILNTLDILPDSLLVYLMVEIKKMIAENGCFEFENREPGCLSAYFKALSDALNNTGDLILTEEQLKKWHGICTNKQNVKMKQIDESSSGNYRDGSEALLIPRQCISVAGLEQLIDLIENQGYSTMFVGPNTMYVEMDKLSKIISEQESAMSLLKFIMKSSTQDNNLKSFNEFRISDLNIEYDLTEEKFFKVVNDSNLLKEIVTEINNLIPNPQNTHSQEEEQLITLNNKLLSEKSADEFLTTLNQIWSLPIGAKLLKNVDSSIQRNVFADFSKALDCQYHLISKGNLWDTMRVYKAKDIHELAEKMYNQINQSKDSLYFSFPEVDELNILMKQHTTNHNNEIHHLKQSTVDEKLTFLAKYLQQYLLIHPFADGNNRTFVNVSALHFAVQQKLPLFIFFDPFIFYAHSVPEIVNALKIAIANFEIAKDAAQSKNLFNFDFLNMNLSKEDLTNIAQFVNPLREYLEQQKIKVFVDQIKNELMHAKLIDSSATGLFKPLKDVNYSDPIEKLITCKNLTELKEALNSVKNYYEINGNEKAASILAKYQNMISQETYKKSM